MFDLGTANNSPQLPLLLKENCYIFANYYSRHKIHLRQTVVEANSEQDSRSSENHNIVFP